MFNFDFCGMGICVIYGCICGYGHVGACVSQGVFIIRSYTPICLVANSGFIVMAVPLSEFSFSNARNFIVNFVYRLCGLLFLSFSDGGYFFLVL